MSFSIADKMSPELLFACVLLGMVGVVTIVSNCLVLRTMFVCDRIRNSLFVICSGIAFADILYIVLAVPIEIMNNSQQSHLINKRLCKTIAYLTHTAHYVCIYHIVGLSIVRAIFLTTRIPPGPTALKGLSATITLWVVGLLANIPMLDYNSLVTENPDSCLLPAMIDYHDKLFTYIGITMSYGLPVILIVVVYAVTYVLCRRYCDNTHSIEDKRMARLITGVVCTFMLFWLPLHLLVIFTMRHFESIADKRYPTLQDQLVQQRLFTSVNFVWALTQIDKCIRPLIYMGISSEFRRSYNEIIDCTICCNKKAASAAVNHANNNDMSQSQLVQPLNTTDGNISQIGNTQV